MAPRAPPKPRKLSPAQVAAQEHRVAYDEWKELLDNIRVPKCPISNEFIARCMPLLEQRMASRLRMTLKDSDDHNLVVRAVVCVFLFKLQQRSLAAARTANLKKNSTINKDTAAYAIDSTKYEEYPTFVTHGVFGDPVDTNKPTTNKRRRTHGGRTG